MVEDRECLSRQECPLWVRSRHMQCKIACPLYPRKQTLAATPSVASGGVSWMLQKPQVERREHQDNSDVYYQPLPEPVPEEQGVHAGHNGYQCEHVKHDGCLSSHTSFLLRCE